MQVLSKMGGAGGECAADVNSRLRKYSSWHNGVITRSFAAAAPRLRACSRSLLNSATYADAQENVSK
jgi:hypothetical protein